MVERTRTAAPLLLPWVTRKPLQALALADRWDALLAVVQWRTERPEASVYLRQIDVPGVHGKFIEEHQAVRRSCSRSLCQQIPRRPLGP